MDVNINFYLNFHGRQVGTTTFSELRFFFMVFILQVLLFLLSQYFVLPRCDLRQGYRYLLNVSKYLQRNFINLETLIDGKWQRSYRI